MDIPLWKYCFIFFLISITCINFSLAQDDPIRDSLQNLIEQAKGIQKVDQLLVLSLHEYGSHRYKPGLEIAQEALALAKKINYIKGVALAYRRGGLNYDLLEREKEAEENYFKALEILSGIRDSAGIVTIYLDLGARKSNLSEFDQALDYFDKASEIAFNMNNEGLYLLIGDLYSKVSVYTGNVNKEESFHLKILDKYKKNKWNASDSYIKLGRFYVNHGYYPKGIYYFRMADSAIAVREDMDGLEHWDRCFLRAKQTGNIARAYRLWGYYDSSLFYHRLSLKQMLLCENRNPVDIGNQLEGIGIVYSQIGVLDSARIYFQKSISYRQGDPLGIGFCYDGLGYISWLSGDYEKAVEHFLKALIEKSKVFPYHSPFNRIFSFKEGLSISHQRLGLVYTDWNLPELALDEFNKALALCQEIGFASGETEALIGIGKLYLQKIKFDNAQDFFIQALQKSSQSTDLPMQAISLKNLGILKIYAGEFEESLKYLNQAAEICQKVGNPIEMTEIDFYLGKAEFLEGDFAEAEKKLQESLELGVKRRISKIVMDAHDQLAKLYEQLGNTKLAFIHLEAGSALRDSVFNRQTAFFLNDINESNEEKKLQLELEVATKAKELQDAAWMGHRNRFIGLTGVGILLITLAYLFSGYKRLKSQNHSMMLQQKVFRSHMNPAFINDSLDDLSNVINQSEPTKAVNYISEFARYFQQVLYDMRNETIKLDQEVHIIKSFINLKKSAYPDRFDFRINMDPELEFGSRRILPFTVQPAIEKGIRNIFSSDAKGGILNLTIQEKETCVVFIVEDNGVSESDAQQDNEITDNQRWNRTELEIPYLKDKKKTGFFGQLFSGHRLFLFLVSFHLIGCWFIANSQEQISLDSTAWRFHILSDQFRKVNNYDSAYHYLRLYVVAKDSLDMRNRLTDIENLEKKYNIETKQSQIKLVTSQKSLQEIKVKRMRYSFFGLTGLFLTGLILWSLLQNRSRLRANQAIKKAEQYLLLSQVNPHFIHNALTNIQSLIMKRDKGASFLYLGHFRELTGKILENSDLDFVRLEDELQIITSYINLQKLRYGNKFDHLMSVDEASGIMDCRVPPMILQPFVENAIEHGLKHKEVKGLLKILAKKNESGGLTIEIKDNGIGRQRSMEIAATQPGKHNGLATVITQDRIKRINQEKQMEVSLEIKDLTDDAGNAKGTLVKLNINQYKKS